MTLFFSEKKQMFIRWASRRFHIDAGYWMTNGFWLVTRRVIAMAFTFALAIAFANFLPKETYGTYKYILSVFGILGSLTLSGMNTAVDQSIAKGFDSALRDGYRVKKRWNMIASLVAVGVAVYYFAAGNLPFASAYFLFALVFPLWDASLLFDEYLRAKENFKKSALYDMVQHIGVSLALLVALFILPKTAIVFVIVWLVVQGCFSVYFYRKVSRDIPDSAQQDPGTLRYAGHLSVMSVVGTVANQIENILLFRLLGPASLAVYTFAAAIPEQMKGVLANIGTMAFPRFAKRTLEESRSSLIRKTPILFGIGIVAVGAYVFVAPWIYATFFPTYIDAVWYSQLFSLSLLNMTIAPSAVILQAHKKTGEQYVSNIVWPIVRIAVVVVGILWWGILGAVVARIISRIGGSLLDFFLLSRAKGSQEPVV